jgi:hypothetical protein
MFDIVWYQRITKYDEYFALFRNNLYQSEFPTPCSNHDSTKSLVDLDKKYKVDLRDVYFTFYMKKWSKYFNKELLTSNM